MVFTWGCREDLAWVGAVSVGHIHHVSVAYQRKVQESLSIARPLRVDASVEQRSERSTDRRDD
jgi:hypothetical protein